MFADVGGIPTVITKGGDEDRGHSNFMWVFALVIIFLALVFLWGRNRDGSTGIAEIAALSAVNNNPNNNLAPAAFTELNSRLDAIQREVGHNNDLAELRALYTQACSTDMNVTQQAFNVSNLVNQTRTDTLLNLKDAALQLANCCCDINRNVDNSRFEAAQNTCNIINNDNNNTQKILDRLCSDETARLRDTIAAERQARTMETFAASQANQNMYLVNTLRPYPMPSYTTINPAVGPVQYAYA